MLRPKQFVPLYNGARTWLAAGIYKGTSLEDSGHGHEASDYDGSKLSRKDEYTRERNGLACTDPYVVQSAFLDGFNKTQVSSSLSRPAAVGNSGDAPCRSLEGSLRVLPASVREKMRAELLFIEDDCDKKELAFGGCVQKLGIAAAGKLLELRDDSTTKKGGGPLSVVHRSGRSSGGQNSSRRKAKPEPVKKSSTPLRSSERGRPVVGGNKSFAQKPMRQFSTCSQPAQVKGDPTNSLTMLADGVNQMKIASEMPSSSQEKATHEKAAKSGYSRKDYVGGKTCPVICLDSGNDETGTPQLSDGLCDWHTRSESYLAVQGVVRHADVRRAMNDTRQKAFSRQVRGGMRGPGRDLVEAACDILKLLGWCQDTKNALSKMDKKLTPYHVNEVLKRQQDVRLALEFFDWAKQQEGFKHDVHTYTTMMGILGRARKFDIIACLLEDMVKGGCTPSVVTFNRLIHSYGRANQMAEALQIFHHMHRVGCNPDKVTYCTLIDLHAKAGFLDVAMDLYCQMQEAGLQPDTFTYSVIINCLGKAGELSDAQKVFNEMVGKGCVPNLITYNILIDLHAKSGKYDMALQLYNDMQETGFRPDQVTYSIVMEVLGHAGHLEEAEIVFAEMLQSGCSPDTTVYGLLVDMWGKAGNLAKSCEWYNKMLDSGVKPSVPTCNSLLGAFLRENLYDSAADLLKDMQDQVLIPSLQTYTLLLSCYTMSTWQADCERIWGLMASLSHPAHAFLYSFLTGKAYGMDIRTHTSEFFEIICSEDQESKRSFTDAMINFLHKCNMKADAAVVWEVATDRQIYPKAVTRKAPKYWAINLHTMSMGTAIVALSRTLSNLKQQMLSTGIAPERIDIITGWGRRSRVTGSSLVKQAVEEILQAVSSPFRLENGNLGCFVGIGRPLVDWLYSSDMEQMHLI